jgi:excisionase family DNA binding protein
MARKLTELLQGTSKRRPKRVHPTNPEVMELHRSLGQATVETKPTAMAPLAIGVRQAAAAAGLSARFLRSEIKARRLRVIRKGRRVLVPLGALKKYLEIE